MDNSLADFIKHISDISYSNIKNTVAGFNLGEHAPESVMELIEAMKNDTRGNIRKLGDSILKSINNREREIERVRKLYDFDNSFGHYNLIAGVDEVGRGPLAGPIVAAAVILNLKEDLSGLILGINDSKKLSSKVRKELSEIIKDKAISYSIVEISSDEIDDLGISYCNNKAFKECCNLLKYQPDLVLSDGYSIKDFSIKNEYVIKGDTKSANIACASIIAKVYRDNLMEKYSNIYPQYGFENNVGYGSQQHIDAIKTYGICPIHRKSFLKNILNEEV